MTRASKRKWVLLLSAVALVLTYGCGGGGSTANCSTVVNGDGAPMILMTSVPHLGTYYDLEGIVAHVAPSQYRVVVYINVAGGWWIKPYYSEPVTPINCDGTWNADITTGGNDSQARIIVAYLIPVSYDPPLHYDQNELEKNSVDHETQYR